MTGMVNRNRSSVHGHRPTRSFRGSGRNAGPGAAEPAPQAWTAVRDWLAVIVPPTTLVTALAFWFGYTFTSARTSYVGVDASILQFSTTDYLVRSAEPIIVPAAVLLALFLAAIGAHALIDGWTRAQAGHRTVRTISAALGLLGLLLLLLGIQLMFVPPPPWTHYLAPPALLGAGSTFAGYGFYTLRTAARRADPRKERRSIPSWEKSGYVVLGLLVILSLFWATTSYAGALGRGRALAGEQRLSTNPSVVLYSKLSLALTSPVLETRIDTPDSLYKFRYTGLRFMFHSTDKYFLYPEGWTRSKGAIIVLEDDPNIRLEFKAGS